MKIERIEKSKHKQERVLVYLEGGDLLKITGNELLQFGLCKGMDLSDALVLQLKKQAAHSERKLQAARMASCRMLSKEELRQRLQRKGADAEEAADLAERMEELGAVNDRVYAGVVVRHYAAMGYGYGRVRQELYRRGIPKDLWDDALTELPEASAAIERYIRSKLKGKSLDRDMIRKLTAALQRRGFSWNEIRPVLNRMGQEIEE